MPYPIAIKPKAALPEIQGGPPYERPKLEELGYFLMVTFLTFDHLEYVVFFVVGFL